jgi:hypothetical protein
MMNEVPNGQEFPYDDQTGLMRRICDRLSRKSVKSKVFMLVVYVIIDVVASIVIPINMRRWNTDTRDLCEVGRESGFVIYENNFKTNSSLLNSDFNLECQNKFTISLTASISYGLSIVVALLLLYIQTEKEDEDSNEDERAMNKIMNISRTTMVFTIRNITLFNLMNMMSSRDDETQIVRIRAVRMITEEYWISMISSFVISSLVVFSFPYGHWIRLTEISVGIPVTKVVSMIVGTLLIHSIIYYIGATNVLGVNVLSMYDGRGPELLTINYWNYGTLFIIYIEWVLINTIRTFRNHKRRLKESLKLKESRSLKLEELGDDEEETKKKDGEVMN